MAFLKDRGLCHEMYRQHVFKACRIFFSLSLSRATFTGIVRELGDRPGTQKNSGLTSCKWQTRFVLLGKRIRRVFCMEASKSQVSCSSDWVCCRAQTETRNGHTPWCASLGFSLQASIGCRTLQACEENLSFELVLRSRRPDSPAGRRHPKSFCNSAGLDLHSFPVLHGRVHCRRRNALVSTVSLMPTVAHGYIGRP